MANLTIKCITGVLTDGEGCGNQWTENRRIDNKRNPMDVEDYLTAKCPKCGHDVALAATVREVIS